MDTYSPLEKAVDEDGSTVDSDFTPPPSVTESDMVETTQLQPRPDPDTPPVQGNTYIVKSATTDEVIALVGGEIRLQRPEEVGAFEWLCIGAEGGYIGFKNIISGKLLGRDRSWRLACYADGHNMWEWFHPRHRSGQGYVLFMIDFWEKRPVAVVEYGGRRCPAMIKCGDGNELVWQFIKVQDPMLQGK